VVNAAKIANFSDIGGWVVVGCWESSLLECRDFLRPVITPFELKIALQSDAERQWSGEWRGDFEGLGMSQEKRMEGRIGEKEDGTADERPPREDGGDLDSEEESEPPEFDLRTGRYVSHTRPMRTHIPIDTSAIDDREPRVSKAITKRAKGDLATVNGAVSPGAEYLRSQRTWTGLGSEFHEHVADTAIREGRSGVARGYAVGEEEERR